MRVCDEYKTHHYMRVWEKTDEYCPWCGERQMWSEVGADDYYQGSEYACLNCGRSSYLDLGGSEVSPSILEQLRTGITHEPTTPRGR